MKYFPLEPFSKVSPIFQFLVLVVSVLLTSSCSKEEKVPTLFDSEPGFTVKIPKQFSVDKATNPNTALTTTWLRDDGLSLLAIDRQPLAGERLEKMQEQGNRKYLIRALNELNKDLSNQLKVYKKTKKKAIELDGRDATVLSFETRQEGIDYKVYVLLTLQLGETPHEVMFDYRVPSKEASEDKVWNELLKSFTSGKEGAPEEKEIAAEEDASKKDKASKDKPESKKKDH